jgi:ATP-binding cassette subfamily F protein 3
VLHFEGGSAFAYVGSYESFVQQREERRLTQQRQFDKQQAKIAAETDYIARNLAGQNTRQAKGRRKLLARMPRLSAPIGADGVMALRLDAGDRSGDRVIEAKGVAVGVPSPDGPRTLVRDVQVVLERGEVVALVGPNGAGKSTLIKTLLGEMPPFSGEVRVGPSTTVAYYRQDVGHLPLESTIYDAIANERPLWERRQVQGHLGRYGFSGDEVQRTVGTLSGGERARVAMALLTLSTNNLLILDEPTNHLDVESIEVLEDAVEEYDGSVLIVSHDRAVLRGLATQVWELRNNALTVFPGTFVEWEQMRAERATSEAKETRANDRKDAERAVRQREREREQREREKQHGGDPKKLLRTAEKALADAELRVATLEAKIADLTEQLDDASLYDNAAGVKKAAAMGKALDEARDQLEEAMHDWETADEYVGMLRKR